MFDISLPKGPIRVVLSPYGTCAICSTYRNALMYIDLDHLNKFQNNVRIEPENQLFRKVIVGIALDDSSFITTSCDGGHISKFELHSSDDDEYWNKPNKTPQKQLHVWSGTKIYSKEELKSLTPLPSPSQPIQPMQNVDYGWLGEENDDNSDAW